MSRAPEDFVRRTVRPLAAYGPPRDPAPVALHLNESPSDLPPELKRQLAAELQAMDWSKYPINDGSRLAADLARANDLDPKAVLVGNGSNELLQLLLFACVEPGDTVVVAEPSFSLYALQAKALGARVVSVPLRAPSGEFRFPLEELVRASEDAKLVLLGSPNNPTGTTLSFEDASLLSRAVPCLLGIDEAYRDFCGQDFAPLLARSPRLVLFRTFSKALAAASLRAGCMLASPALCAELRKVQLPYNLSAFAALIARALLARPELVTERARLVVAERERIGGALRELGIDVHPSGANFILFEQTKRPANELHAALFRRGVLIRNVSSAKGLERALRVSIGAPAANDAFLAAIRAELPA
ncbi:MAG TPA: aminotransferase class I/II-fold pyridoxal phosphate-dependent enzyme [Myxococcales bacterium]|nr:aminotransferase class I/II-fold pyridoxal phosphate-dependent enzyme [Myxococcales bacterium]